MGAGRWENACRAKLFETQTRGTRTRQVNPALIGDASSQPCSSHVVRGEWFRSIDPESVPGFKPLLFGGAHVSGVETDIV